MQIKKYIKKFLCIIELIILRKHYKKTNGIFNKLAYSSTCDLTEKFSYFDEYSKEINNMFNFKNLDEKVKEKYYIENEEIKINSIKEDGENWVCFEFENKVKKNFVFSFEYFQERPFCEFQVAFNYLDFKNRNRFIIMENEYALFDYISKGKFYPPVYRQDCKDVLKNNSYNKINLINSNDEYLFVINDKCIMSIKEKKRLLSGNNFMIVLWENDRNRLISSKIRNVKLQSIK